MTNDPLSGDANPYRSPHTHSGAAPQQVTRWGWYVLFHLAVVLASIPVVWADRAPGLSPDGRALAAGAARLCGGSTLVAPLVTAWIALAAIRRRGYLVLLATLDSSFTLLHYAIVLPLVQ